MPPGTTPTTLGPLRVEHVDNARRQGGLAARSMLGQDVAYDWQPYFFTDQFEFSMEYVGRSAPEAAAWYLAATALRDSRARQLFTELGLDAAATRTAVNRANQLLQSYRRRERVTNPGS